MPQWLSKQVIQYLVFPLVLKLADYIRDKFIMSQINRDQEQLKKERAALYVAISKAQTDEQRKALSVTLARLNDL